MEQPTDVQDVRVVHFGLGPLGSAIARLVAARDGLTSVAAIDAASTREGRDLGDVAGLGASTDVVVEASPARLRDIEADVVLFAPDGDIESATNDLEVLLEVGLNVVVVLPELAYPPDEDDDLAVSIDTLAREAEVTAVALDPSDALLGVLPLALTSVCSQVDRVVVRRRGEGAGVGRHALADWARGLAAALGWSLDNLDEVERERPGSAEPGSGVDHRVAGSAGGREVLVVELVAGGDGAATLDVEVTGVPSLRLTVAGGESAQQALATLAVNAIPAALTSDPGLYSLADLPPVHYWTSLGLMPADEDEGLDDDL